MVAISLGKIIGKGQRKKECINGKAEGILGSDHDSGAAQEGRIFLTWLS